MKIHIEKNLEMIKILSVFRNYQKILFTVVIIGFMLMVSGGTNQNSTLVTSSTGPTNSLMYEKNIIIDGNIDDWLNPVAVDEFYLDLDNSGNPNNLDGNNYLYVDEDSENVYIALDLPSDQTDDTSGEWVSISLNTNMTATSSWPDWGDNFNKGIESFIFDVDNNQVWDPYLPSISTSHFFFGPGNAKDVTVATEYGSIQFYNSISDYSTPYFENNVTHESEQVGSEYWSKVDFNINLTRFEELGVFGSNEKLQFMENFNLEVELKHNVSVLSSEVNMWHPENPQPFSGYSIDTSLNTNTSYTTYNIPFSKSLMDGSVLRMSLFTRNNVAFKSEVPHFWIEFDEPMVHSAVSGASGSDRHLIHTTIDNFDFAFDFTSSANNASDHRIFELKIPKSELEGYNSASDLGIYVGGYGTASFVNSNYWAYDGINPVPDDIYSLDSTRYHYYPMPLKNPPGEFVLSSLVNDHSVDLSWTTSANTDNYTLFQSLSPITSISNTLEVIGIFQDVTSPVNVQLPNGEYYFVVVASNNTGFIESNHVSVSIDIRTETYSTTITSTVYTTITETGPIVTETGPTTTEAGLTVTEPGSTDTETVIQTSTVQADTTTETVTATSIKTEESPVQMVPILLGLVILGFYKFKKTVK